MRDAPNATAARGDRMTATAVYNKTPVVATPAVRSRPRITKPTSGGRPTNDPKGTLVAVRLSARQVQILERRSHREDTGLSEALRRCLDEWDAADRPSKQEAIKKQRVAVVTQPARRRTRRETK
jgi:hypothetical protein